MNLGPANNQSGSVNSTSEIRTRVLSIESLSLCNRRNEQALLNLVLNDLKNFIKIIIYNLLKLKKLKN